MFDFQCSKTFLQLLCSRESGCMFFLCPPKFLYDIYDLFMIHSWIFYDSEIKLLDIDITNVNMGPRSLVTTLHLCVISGRWRPLHQWPSSDVSLALTCLALGTDGPGPVGITVPAGSHVANPRDRRTFKYFVSLTILFHFNCWYLFLSINIIIINT